MKQYLVILALAGTAAAAQEQGVATVPTPAADIRVAPAKALSPIKASGPRQLSAEERAELRRQLYQYRRLSGKRS